MDVLNSLEMDKRTEVFAIRIPKILKDRLDGLPKAHKDGLNERLIIEMARTIHNANFNPIEYLISE